MLWGVGERWNLNIDHHWTVLAPVHSARQGAAGRPWQCGRTPLQAGISSRPAHARGAAVAPPLGPLPPLPSFLPQFANLFTNLNMGWGTRPFASGGRGDRGAHAGAASVGRAASARACVRACVSAAGHAGGGRPLCPPVCHSPCLHRARQHVLAAAQRLGQASLPAWLRLWSHP